MLEEGWVAALLHELLRWLVYVHLGHLRGCLIGGSFSLFFLFLRYIDALKFIEHILIVQEGVRELIQEVLSGQEAINATLQNWYLKQLVNRRSLSRVTL